MARKQGVDVTARKERFANEAAYMRTLRYAPIVSSHRDCAVPTSETRHFDVWRVDHSGLRLGVDDSTVMPRYNAPRYNAVV